MSYPPTDADPPEWQPPSYAKSVDDWEPPDYAQPIKDKEEKKPGVLSKIVDALKPAERIHPGEGPKAKLDRFLTDILATDKHPELKRILTSQNPAGESVLPKTSEVGIREPITWTGGFLKGLYDEFVRPIASPAGAAMGLAFGESGPLGKTEQAAAQELPIIQASREIPYRVSGELPSVSGEALPIRQPLGDEQNIRLNPQTGERFSGDSPNKVLPEDLPRDISPIRKQMVEQTIKEGQEAGVPDNPVAKKLEETRNAIEEKPKFVNPFEKKAGEWKPPEYAQPVEEAKIPTLYHGTRNVIEDFDVTKNQPHGLFPNMTRMTENPEYSSLYSLGETPSGLKRQLRNPENGNPNTIAAKIEPNNILDLTKSIPQEQLTILQDSIPELKGQSDPAFIQNILSRTDKDIPFDAIKYSEHGETNWAVSNKTPIKTPSGVPLNEVAKKNWQPPDYAKPLEENFPRQLGQDDNGIVEMSGGLGGIKPSTRPLNPSSGPYGAALDKLFQSMGDIKEKRVAQDIINRTEQARRFAKFNSVDDVGVQGAAKSLSALKGEYAKVDLDKLKMTQPQVDSLFTAVKRANITPGEKARGYTALFKLFNGEGVPQRNELQILDDVFGNNFSNKIIEMHGGVGGGVLKLAKVANTMKSMQNALSLAAPLRHGIGLATRKEFYPAFVDMFKFFGNKEYFDGAMQAIEDHPNYLKAKESGLFLAKPNSLMNSEEEFLNSYVGNLPKFSGIPQVVAASQRAYSGFLNKLRFDTFNSMIKQAEGLGNKMFTDVGGEQVPSKEAMAISKFINNATGRGDLGSLNKMTNELNLLLWSPRMISSRINMLANPKIYMDLPKGMRLEGLKSLLGIAALGTTVDTLASYGGAKVSSNILSTDAGKSRFGTHLIDPWGGFQQYIVAAARFLAGRTDSSMPTNRAEIAGRFLANKESPAANLAHELLTAKFTGKSEDPETAGNMTTQYGQKTSIQSEIGKRFLPIFVQDIVDLAKSEPKWSDSVGLTGALGLASLAGMSQDYPEKKTQKMKLGTMKPRKLSVR